MFFLPDNWQCLQNLSTIRNVGVVWTTPLQIPVCWVTMLPVLACSSTTGLSRPSNCCPYLGNKKLEHSATRFGFKGVNFCSWKVPHYLLPCIFSICAFLLPLLHCMEVLKQRLSQKGIQQASRKGERWLPSYFFCQKLHHLKGGINKRIVVIYRISDLS